MIFAASWALSSRLYGLAQRFCPSNIEYQRAQIALAARRLGLRMADELVDVGYLGMSMDRPDLCRLLDHLTAHRVGFCVVATLDRLSEDPEHMADTDEALDDALVAIMIAADHIGPERDGA